MKNKNELEKYNKNKGNFFISLGISNLIIGAFAIIIGWNIPFNAKYVNNRNYGGDAYTGIQNAAAITANNIDALGKAYIESYNWFMTIIGLTISSTGLITAIYGKSIKPKIIDEYKYEVD